MLRELIRKEILDHMMSLRFAIACVLCLFVIFCSLFVRHQDFSQTRAATFEAVAANQATLRNLSSPSRLIWRGVQVHCPPNPLKILVRGVEDENGRSVRVTVRGLPEFEAADQAGPLHLLFPPVDMVSFIGIIMSLLAVVFGYDSVCGEKERGTLRLMLAQSVPRDTVLAAKWIGGYVSLVLPFLIAVLAGATLVLAQPDVMLTPSQWGRLAAVLGFALLYIAAVFSVTLWVSCVTVQSATSIMVLITLWLLFVLVVPNVGPFLASSGPGLEGLDELASARQQQSSAIWREKISEPTANYDKVHGVDAEWWKRVRSRDWEARKPAEERQLYRMALEKDAALTQLRMHYKVEEKFVRRLEGQVRRGRWFSRLSPFSCFALAATELTDTGVQSTRRFLDQLREYQLELCSYAHDERIAQRQYRLDNEGENPPPWVESRQAPIPEFVYTPPAATEYLKMVMVDFAVLTGMAVVFFMLSTVRFLRYDVR